MYGTLYQKMGAVVVILIFSFINEQVFAHKKYCWYFEGGYPIYFICRPYEDCCGMRCCVRALSIQRLWSFWLLLIVGMLFCCGAGFFIRRRILSSPLPEEPAFNVTFTRQPMDNAGLHQNGTIGGGANNSPTHPSRPHPHCLLIPPTALPPPPYSSLPPPHYEEVVLQDSQKKRTS